MGKRIDVEAPDFGPLTADEISLLLKSLVTEMTTDQVVDALIGSTTEMDREEIAARLQNSVSESTEEG